MDEKIRELIERHHAYYEVIPYYTLIEEGHGTPAALPRRIDAGFDVDVYAIKSQRRAGAAGDVS